MKIYAWDEVEETLPPLGIPERLALQKSIEEDGVKQPILVLPDGRIIDGHHRWRSVGDNVPFVIVDVPESKAFDLAMELNLARRQLSREQLKIVREKQKRKREEALALALEMRRQDTAMTQQDAADAVGISRPSVSKAQRNITNVPNASENISYIPPDVRVKVPVADHPTIHDRHLSGETQAQIAADYQVKQPTISGIVRKEKLNREKEQRRQEAASKGKLVELPDDVAIWTGDFKEKAKDIPDDSVDLIFTDPPYDRVSVPLYGDLAEMAARVLKPGGSLLTYIGHYVLPDILDLMTPHLTFWWVIAIEHTGSQQMMYQKGVTVGWKPILWFVKDTRRFDKCFSDHFKSSPPTKDEHDWQQDVSEALYYIEHLTKEDNLVIDPFCGSGTTLIAAKRLGRKSIGIEENEDNAARARKRIGSESE